MDGRRPYSRIVGRREGLRNKAAVSSETNCFSALSCVHSVRNIPVVTNAAALRYANSKYCMDMSGGEVSNGGAADAKVTRTCI